VFPMIEVLKQVAPLTFLMALIAAPAGAAPQ
jgi:hypothetical protein